MKVSENEEYRMASFVDLVTLLEREARISMNPSYGEQYDMSATASLASATTSPPLPHPTRTSGSRSFHDKVGPCGLCKHDHNICECPELMRRTPDERKEFVIKEGLCFGCLCPGHLSKTCKKRQTCNKCQRRHPTVLHIEEDSQYEKQPGAVTSCRISSAKVYHTGAKLPIISVLVKLGDKEVKTCAFLDSGSTHSFCSTALFKRLGVESKDQMTLRITTVDRERQIGGFMVHGLVMTDEERNTPFSLPPLFTLERIPVSEDDIVRTVDLSQWSYLVHSDVTLPTVTEEVGLLLGNDCGYAMEPIEIVPSENGGPYAIRTRYGWILGGVQRQKVSAQVNKLSLADALQGSLDPGITDNLADTQVGPSVEDAMWCKKVASSCKISENKHEISLPFKDDELKLPNNYGTARKRMSRGAYYAPHLCSLLILLLISSNRLAIIHDGSCVHQWKYVSSDQNQADVITRGQRATEFMGNTVRRQGPCLLWTGRWPIQMIDDGVTSENRETKRVG